VLFKSTQQLRSATMATFMRYSSRTVLCFYWLPSASASSGA
jgi:hypothetical protein